MNYTISKERASKCKSDIEARLVGDPYICFLDLGIKTVRILCYSSECLALIKKHLTYSYKEEASNYDYTIVVWKENDFASLHHKWFPELNSTNLRYRVEMLALKSDFADLDVSVNDSSDKIVEFVQNKTITFYNEDFNTVYYCICQTAEGFVKNAHMLKQELYSILKTNSSSLVHGACIGYDSKGILFCAKGRMGKSTLTVLAMLKGAEYVSDDFLTLQKKEDGLFAYPIYSTITLSPTMYDEMYDLLDGSKFISNNFLAEKYVLNIANFHNRFKNNYKIKVCMFPHIVSDKEPSVVKCSKEEKESAIQHMVVSTLSQMHDLADKEAAAKIHSMLEPFTFYEIRLCRDIYKNVECLEKFSETL